MDEELRKRNTDCVYFLASPLTCKKGVECEYRHSEIARLNPRECWYWLAGNCLNPSCGFRHPPVNEPLKKIQLAGAHNELSSETAFEHYQCTAPANKSIVPCYFYFNGSCNKGDRCSFLHGPDDGAPPWKSLETVSAISDAPFLENKTSAGNDARSGPIETRPNPSEAGSSRAVEILSTPREDVHLLALGNVKDRSASPDILASEGEEASAVRSGKLTLGKGLLQTPSLVCTDQSSEEQVDHIEREDWLESSPGFDVLVDDRSENMGYEDGLEYLLATDRDGRELNGNVSGFDYKDPIEYDPVYPDAGILYEQAGLDSFVQFDNELISDYMIKVPGCSTGKMLDPIFPQKRKLLPVDLAIDGGRDVDLRDHLRKRMVIDGHRVTRFSRRNNSSCQIDQRQERSRRHGMQRLRGRLTTKMDSNCLGSLSKNGTPLNGAKPQGWFQQSYSNRSRQHYKDKWQSKQHLHSSEVPRKPVSNKRRSTEKSVMFTSPKTLAQIKEEKRKAAGNGNFIGKSGYSTTDISEEFQGPKPLSEILDDKKRLGSVMDANNDSRKTIRPLCI